MKRWTRIMIFVLLLSAWGGASAFAQFSSGIEGIVHDTTGAVVARAKVTVTDTRLGVSNIVHYWRKTATSASTASPHPPTPSRFKWPASQTWKQAGLALQIAEIRTLTPELKVGEVSTNVEVSATAASVDLVTPTTGSIISNVTLAANAADRAERLRPRVADARHDRRRRGYGRQRQLHQRIRDQPQRSGPAPGGERVPDRRRLHQHALPRRRHIDLSQSRDCSVRWTSAPTTSTPRREGTAAATVDVYTVSGSNQFHGNIDWYFTNNSLSATTHFQSSVPTFYAQRDGRHHGRADFQEQALLVRRHRCAAFKQPQQLHGHSGNAGLLQLGQNQRTQHGRPQFLTMAPPANIPHHGSGYGGHLRAAFGPGGTPGYFAPPAGIHLPG